MDLQLQIRRALIAFVLWAALGGIALSRASAQIPAAAHPQVWPHGPGRVLVSAERPERVCRAGLLRIDVTASVRVSVPCDRSCKALDGIAQVLGMPAELQPAQCALPRSA